MLDFIKEYSDVLLVIQGATGLLVIVGALWKISRWSVQLTEAVKSVRTLAEQTAADLKGHKDDCRVQHKENAERFEEGAVRMERLETNQRAIAEDVSELKDDVRYLKTDVSDLKTDVAEIKGGLKTLLHRSIGSSDR